MIKAVSYVAGIPQPIPINLCGAVLEVRLENGRTVQMSVGDDGEVVVRAWGNVPAKVGNAEQAGAHFKIAFEPQNHCPVCYDKIRPEELYRCGCCTKEVTSE